MSPRMWLAKLRLLEAQAHLDVASNGSAADKVWLQIRQIMTAWAEEEATQ